VLTDGFFALQTPTDMLTKLRHDFDRCRDRPMDTYAAFDFVVTGTHLHEWALKHGITRRPTAPLHQLVFALCALLGNGAKHFSMKQRRPAGHAMIAGPFDPDVFDPAVFGTGALVVYLDANEAAVYGASSITVVDLAAMVLGYWEELLRR